MRTAIVAHDAGGAELLAAWVRRQRGDGGAFSFAVDGPALAVFRRTLGAVDSRPLAGVLAGADRLLAGTGWQSRLETDAIAMARARGLPSAAFLDHWVNYRERFVRAGVAVLPDELWVGDPIALALARRLLPEVPARQVDNPYFADLREALAQQPPRPPRAAGAPHALLYVCEPIAAHAQAQFGNPRHWGYTEHDALRYTLGHLHRLGAPVGRIVVRRHPSEPDGKYRDTVAGFDLPLQFSDGRPLIAEVAASDIVVGCNSMAMVIGLLAGKRVVSAIPPGGGGCALPQPEIGMLRACPAAPAGSIQCGPLTTQR